MTRLVTALLMLVAMGLPAMAEEVAPGAQAAISEALAAIGCTVEADDVKCKDGEFEVTFDKDFKIKSKEKDEY